MARLKRDPDATPEQNAARVVQNAAEVFGPKADRFAAVCERYAEDMDPEARQILEAWVRRWAARLVAATLPERPRGHQLHLLDPRQDNGDGPEGPSL
jgi:hypothetical protein